MNEIINIIIQLIAGAAGGHLAGAIKQLNLGATGNSIAGGIGGLILGQLGSYLTNDAAVSQASNLIEHVLGSGLGGVVATALIAIIKNLINKSNNINL